MNLNLKNLSMIGVWRSHQFLILFDYKPSNYYQMKTFVLIYSLKLSSVNICLSIYLSFWDLLSILWLNAKFISTAPWLFQIWILVEPQNCTNQCYSKKNLSFIGVNVCHQKKNNNTLTWFGGTTRQINYLFRTINLGRIMVLANSCEIKMINNIPYDQQIIIIEDFI